MLGIAKLLVNVRVFSLPRRKSVKHRKSVKRTPLKSIAEKTVSIALRVCLAALLVILALIQTAYAEQPPAPCHPNPLAAQDSATVANRGDVVKLPQPLEDTLIRLADRPHSQLPLQIYKEANGNSQLFQYYLLDTSGFQPNVFTKIFPGINDHVQLTATGPNCNLPTIGAVRVVLEPKPGLPTDPNNPRAFNDVFTDLSGLFVINNESGWYEGWMIWDIPVAQVNPTPRPDGHPSSGRFCPLMLPRWQLWEPAITSPAQPSPPTETRCIYPAPPTISRAYKATLCRST
jgi:hypothetical protein